MITKFDNKYGTLFHQITDGEACHELAEFDDKERELDSSYCRHHAGLETHKRIVELVLTLSEIDPVILFQTGKYERIVSTAIARAEMIDVRNTRSPEYDPCFAAIVEEIGEVATVLQDQNYNKTRLRDELYDVLTATIRYLESIK